MIYEAFEGIQNASNCKTERMKRESKKYSNAFMKVVEYRGKVLTDKTGRDVESSASVEVLAFLSVPSFLGESEIFTAVVS